MSMDRTSRWLYSFNTDDAQEQVSSVANTKARTISITGGKGGVGKTSISLKLARELARKGFRTLLLDCDFNLSNTAIKLGIPVQSNFEKLLSAEKPFTSCLYREGLFHLLAGCNGSLEVFDSKLNFSQIILDIIHSHENDYDYIILDSPAGIGRETLSLNAYCDDRIVVVNPDRSSITDSYSLIKILKQKFAIDSNHLIVNKYDSKNQYGRVVKTISETAENFLGCRTQILGGIPRLDSGADKFDQEFLHQENSSTTKIFTKILHRYSERSGNPVDHDISPSMPVLFKKGQGLQEVTTI